MLFKDSFHIFYITYRIFDGVKAGRSSPSFDIRDFGIVKQEELVRLVALFFSYSTTLGAEVVSKINRVDRGAGSFVQLQEKIKRLNISELFEESMKIAEF